MKTGNLIAIEGIDGTGKSGLAAKLTKWINELAGPNGAIASCEPTRGEFGMLARRVGSGDLKVSMQEELEFYFKDRHEHADKLVRPAIDRGVHVVLDRYYFSTVAYQSFGGKFDPAALLESSEQNFLTPDLTIILDIPVATALARAEARAAAGGPAKGAYEKHDFLAHCRDVFLSFAGYPSVSVISAAGTHEDVWERVRRAVLFKCDF